MKLTIRTSRVALVDVFTIKTDTTEALIGRAEGFEHGFVSVKQQPLLGQQSATAKVGNKVRENSSVNKVQRRKRTKEAGQRRRTESYGNVNYEVSQKNRGYRKRMYIPGSRRE